MGRTGRVKCTFLAKLKQVKLVSHPSSTKTLLCEMKSHPQNKNHSSSLFLHIFWNLLFPHILEGRGPVTILLCSFFFIWQRNWPDKRNLLTRIKVSRVNVSMGSILLRSVYCVIESNSRKISQNFDVNFCRIWLISPKIQVKNILKSFENWI